MVSLGGCSIFGIRRGFEQVNYTVLESTEGIEIRQYSPRLVAEVGGLTDRAEAFMALFRYISGENHARERISMTTPVQIDTRPMSMIAAPAVESYKGVPHGIVMRFFLPQSLTAAIPPEPNDPRITIVPLPEETVASIRYSGFDSEERFHQNTERLLEALKQTSWTPASLPSFLGYDRPSTIPFLRRNEVIVSVIPR